MVARLFLLVACLLAAAGEGTTALALPLAVAPARRVEPSRWYERVGGTPLPTALADAGAMVGRLLLVRVPMVGGCRGSGWCLARVKAAHARLATRIAAVHGGQGVRPNYDVRLLHDHSMCHMLLATATYAGDADGPRAPSTHGATAARFGRVGMWMLLEEVQREERAAARTLADDGHVDGEDVDVASAARLEGGTRRSWWKAIDEAVIDADVLRAGIEAEAAAATAESAAAGGAAEGAPTGAGESPITPPTPQVAGTRWATSCIDGFVVTLGLAARMRSDGYREALSWRRVKHLNPTALYEMVRPAATAGRVLGLRLGDMPSGYTKADGSVVPSGWDIFAAELDAFRAYGCALPAEAEVPDAEMAGIILFLERCVRAAEAAGA